VAPRGVTVAADSTEKHPQPARSGPAAAWPEAQGLFRSGEVTQILGISRRQLLYWVRTGLVRPSRTTPGGHHRYSFGDLVALKAAKRLIDAGVSLQALRTSIEALQRTLPSVQRPLAELVLVATGDVVLVLHGGAAFEAVTGQEWVFDVAQFQREVDAWRPSPQGWAGQRTGRVPPPGPAFRSG